jgi:hypothetical protein
MKLRLIHLAAKSTTCTKCMVCNIPLGGEERAGTLNDTNALSIIVTVFTDVVVVLHSLSLHQHFLQMLYFAG